MQQITMPRLSDSMEEGTIIRWLLADGETVAVGAEIAEIETDKATMEFQSEFGGVLHIVQPEGATLPVGTVIGQLLAAGETPPQAGVDGGAPQAADNGAGDGLATPDPGNGDTALAVSPSAVATVPAPAEPAPAAPPPARPSRNGRIAASPVARRLAESLSIDLATLVGSGPTGRIVKRDVLTAAESAPQPAPASASASASAEVTSAAPATSAAPVVEPESAPPGGKGAVTVQEPTRVQATIARRMAEAKASMPEFTLEVEVDMDAAVAMRGEIKALGVEDVPSYNDFVVRACAMALRRFPRANGAWRDGRFELYERINVGVAVAAPDALVVPTVPDADRCSLGEIARATRRLAAAAREGTLTPAQLSGGTFSVSNLGMFGISRFTAVLNPPQAAILAVGALERKPVVRGEAIVIGHVMPMTLTCDHRILYGADAAQFLAEIRAHLEAPLRLAL